jgi:hypothetical protein
MRERDRETESTCNTASVRARRSLGAAAKISLQLVICPSLSTTLWDWPSQRGEESSGSLFVIGGAYVDELGDVAVELVESRESSRNGCEGRRERRLPPAGPEGERGEGLPRPGRGRGLEFVGPDPLSPDGRRS